MMKPRTPGSQVAPGQKPFHRDGRTASTHSKIPMDQVTEGKTYRVRDKDWAHVWDTGLSYADAVKLRESVVTARKSKTARVEDEAIPPPDWYMAESGQVAAPDASSVADDRDATRDVVGEPCHDERDVAAPRTQYSLDDGGVEIAVPAAGIVTKVLAGHELVVNGQIRSLPAGVIAGDRVMAQAVDPVIIAARARAMAVAAAAIPPARPRAPVYRDKTVRPLVPRTAPAPRDKTAKATVHIRLAVAPADVPEPLPSPAAVAELHDGKPLEADVLGDDDVHDLATDIGGSASDADLEYARRQRDAERAG